jgi:methyl-accepting chemotaxis protein
MKSLANEALVLGIMIVTIWITGCAQPDAQSIKMSRVVAAENLQLKEDLRKKDWEIKNLKEQYKEQVGNLENLVADYKEQINVLEEKSRQNIRSQVKEVLDIVLEQNAKLRQENDSLKAQIEKLKPSN